MIKLKHILTEATDNLLQTFPIGSKNFNIGYDSSMKEPETGLNRDTVIQNSDYGGGDAAHRSRGGHLGIDIFAPKGEPVVAPVTGIVIKSSNQDRGDGGKSVTIDKNGISFYHAHLDQVYVEDGQEIKAGQLIGTCGDSGNAAGTHPHVHFSIYRTKEGYSRGSINPWPSLQNVMYTVTKSDKNLDVLHKKLRKLGFDLGDEQDSGINGPKTQAALIKLNKTYNQKQQKGGFTDKIASFLSGIINSDIAQSVLGNKKSKDKPKIQNNDVATTDMPSRVISFLKNKGLTTSQASGIAGNMSIESGFKPDVVGDSGTSYGLVQWHASRWTNLKQYCAKNNLDPASVDGQLEFLWHELKNNSELGLLKLKNQTNPRDAAEVFAKYYERPANISPDRMNNAENYYNEYTKNVADKIA
jgi:murein DD-endopeptidase MepM/ murein hydrolase activator NlpD